MRLHVLGMNGPYPAAGGACSGYLAENGGTMIQLDLGCGSLPALTAIIAPEMLTALVFSHWHHDHCSDALPLLYRMADAVRDGCQPLEVWGPEDPSSPVRQALAASPLFRLHTLAPGARVTLGGAELQAWPARHPVPAVMLRLTMDGKTLCYTGDTNTADGLADFAGGADLLLADGLFPDSLWTEDKPHLSARLAAELAAAAGVRQLVITHLHPDIPAAVLLQEAREAYPRARLAACGDLYTL